MGVTLIIAVLLAPFTLLTLGFALEVFAGLKPLPAIKYASANDQSAVIVVPAHNEEVVILRSLEQLKRSAAGQASILLVADNCTDETAQIGRTLAIEVIERFDSHCRGKGFALDFARTHLERAPPGVVLIVDADCTIDRQSIERLISACAAVQRPCQATNLQLPNRDASPAVQLSTFAFFVKNVIRQRALVRLAGRAHLLGTGMALPWPIFARANLATSNIVEDLKLGQELADSGQSPVFVEVAAVWSRAETGVNTRAQRQRWEGGFLQNAKRVGPRMFAKALEVMDIQLLWAAIDILIPPFALLILLDVAAALLASMFIWLLGAHLWPLLCLCGALTLALVALALTWAFGGSKFVSLGTLCRAPLYVAWKLPMYIGFLRRGVPNEWRRTNRT